MEILDSKYGSVEFSCIFLIAINPSQRWFSQNLTLSAVWYIALGFFGTFNFGALDYLVNEALKCSYQSEFCIAIF